MCGRLLQVGFLPESMTMQSRLDVESEILYASCTAEGREKIQKAKELGSVVKELETTIAALALTWVAKHPDTSTVILGATRPQQIVNNLKAIEVLPKLLPPVMEKIEDMLGNKPSGSTTYHPPLDEFG